MNKMMVGVGVIVVLIVIVLAVYLVGSIGSGAATTSSPSSTLNPSAPTTIPNAVNTTPPTSIANQSGNQSTQTVPPTSISNQGGGAGTTPGGTKPGCSATSGYVCTNASYSISNSVATIWATVGQNTGEEWSSFAVGYAPAGTKTVGGIPQNITFYIVNGSSTTSNVGTSLQSGSVVKIEAYNGVGLGSATSGVLWACYVNSGLLYAGHTCFAQGGGAPFYVQLGALNLTS
ncbi:MAG: hypothetical protein KGH72_01640 [Candidatus Micrarchaeota archaeon]|nr:hypothetical protein [Candidatus Micrarchaeota archaeon]